MKRALSVRQKEEVATEISPEVDAVAVSRPYRSAPLAISAPRSDRTLAAGRAHPIRADRLARALAARTGPPMGWTWRISDKRKSGLPSTFRTPPAPYRERAYSLGPGFCCVCAQPVYRLGWHDDLWDAGPNKNAVWHCACVVAWQFWNAPNSEAPLLRRLQGRRCRQTGGRLWRDAEVDHQVPLFRVWRDRRHEGWPKLLSYWGLPNLQVINRDAHTAKCAVEARDRRAASSIEPDLN